MVTAVLGIAILCMVKAWSDAFKTGRLKRISFLSGAGASAAPASPGEGRGALPPGGRGGSKPGWWPTIKINLLVVAGWCFCSEWFSSHFLQWADFHWGPLPWLLVPILFSVAYLGNDVIDRGGIKPLSYKLAFLLPVLLASTHGMVHDWVVYLPSQPDNFLVQFLDHMF